MNLEHGCNSELNVNGRCCFAPYASLSFLLHHNHVHISFNEHIMINITLNDQSRWNSIKLHVSISSLVMMISQTSYTTRQDEVVAK